MNNKYNIFTKFSFIHKQQLFIFIFISTVLSTISCQKDLKLKYDNIGIKQVILANFVPNSVTRINVSKSKKPDDFNPIEFLNQNKVDLYEDGIFIETMPFILKDTLSGFGYYTSVYKLKQNKTYKVISQNDELGAAYAEEFLPTYPSNVSVQLLQYADTLHPNIKSKYSLTFQDSANARNYYYISAYYKGKRLIIDSLGDTSYKTEYLYNVPSYTAEIPNTIGYYKSFFDDKNFDGQLKTFVFDIASQYDNNMVYLLHYYVEFYFEVEFANVGTGYYEWYLQQMPKNDNTFNNGQNERINFSSNIVNGYGHYSGFSPIYKTIRIK